MTHDTRVADWLGHSGASVKMGRSGGEIHSLSLRKRPLFIIRSVIVFRSVSFRISALQKEDPVCVALHDWVVADEFPAWAEVKSMLPRSHSSSSDTGESPPTTSRGRPTRGLHTTTCEISTGGA